MNRLLNRWRDNRRDKLVTKPLSFVCCSVALSMTHLCAGLITRQVSMSSIQLGRFEKAIRKKAHSDINPLNPCLVTFPSRLFHFNKSNSAVSFVSSKIVMCFACRRFKAVITNILRKTRFPFLREALFWMKNKKPTRLREKQQIYVDRKL